MLVNPTWDNGDTCLASLRHIAREGGCRVIGTATAMQGSDVPAQFPGRNDIFKPDEWFNDGDAVVIQPAGAAGKALARCLRALFAAGYLFFFGKPQAAPAGVVFGLTARALH